jgi:medium-chain acyl-[acyl-carrier-protein] hydrolase
MFQTWAASLPGGIELCPVELPGRGTRLQEPPVTNLETLTVALLAGLLDQFSGAFAFFGHSMGALIAFELARRMEQEYGVAPAHLFVSGRGAPHLANTRRIYDLPHNEFIQELRILNGTPEQILDYQELLGLVLPRLRADFQLVQTYRYLPSAPLRCPISAYGGLNDDTVPLGALEAWRKHTRSTFRCSVFEGHHFYFWNSSAQLLETLLRDLRETRQVAAAR